MKRISIIGCLSVCLFLGGMSGITTAFASSYRAVDVTQGGGGDDKKEKGKKGGKEDEEDEKKQTKMESSPQKAARLSAKTTRKNMRWKHKEITTRAKTRNYFHKTFNTKYGRYTNFRNKFTRNRWRKGKI